MTIKSRVEGCIEQLNKRKPTWLSRIDLSIFELDDDEKCILGQLDGNYWESPLLRRFNMGDGTEPDRNTKYYAFNPAEMDSYQKEWKRQIRKLQAEER
jgi:hypothetical protein